MKGWKHAELSGEVRSAVDAGLAVWRAKASWILVSGYAGETAGESRTPAVVGVVDGGACARCSLVGSIDVAVLTSLSQRALRETFI